MHATPALPSSGQQNRALWSSTFAFTVCFAVWTIFSIIGIQIKKQLGLSEDVAKQMTLQTALGAAHMAITADVEPVLRVRAAEHGRADGIESRCRSQGQDGRCLSGSVGHGIDDG